MRGQGRGYLRAAVAATAVAALGVRGIVGLFGPDVDPLMRGANLATAAVLLSALAILVRATTATPADAMDARDPATALFAPATFTELARDALERGLSHGGRSAIAVVQAAEEGSVPLTEATARCVADAIRANVRPHDLAGRSTDDRFVVVLDRCERDEAAQVCARVLRTIHATSQRHISVACGIAVGPDDGEELAALVRSAARDIRLARPIGAALATSELRAG